MSEDDVYSFFMDWCTKNGYTPAEDPEQFWEIIKRKDYERRIAVYAFPEEECVNEPVFQLFVEVGRYFVPLNGIDEFTFTYNVKGIIDLIKLWENKCETGCEIQYLYQSLPLFPWCMQQNLVYAALLPDDISIDYGDLEIFHVRDNNLRVVVSREQNNYFSAFLHNMKQPLDHSGLGVRGDENSIQEFVYEHLLKPYGRPARAMRPIL